MNIIDRVKELRRVPANQLQPHPRNWRTHPIEQQEVLRGLLDEIGFADALIARQLPTGGLQLVDGHLRAETAADAVVPVLIVDLDDEETEKVLLTLDPLASMATSNHQPLGELLDKVEIQNQAVRQMLEGLQQRVDSSSLPDQTVPPLEVTIPECYQVVVECENELQQREVYERMQVDGFRCRVVTL